MLSQIRQTPPTWQDDFDGDRLDPGRWVDRTDRKMWSAQQPENVTVRDGRLHLGLEKRAIDGMQYTGSGVISTRTFGFGFFEGCFKVPPGEGWHTSFWLMHHDGSGGTTTKGAVLEIDICEQDSVHPGEYALNLHRWAGEHIDFGGEAVKTPDLSADFHTWACDYSPERIRYYFEGKQVAERSTVGLPTAPMYLWLTSIASPLGGTKRVDESTLPSAAIFEWVRYWERG